MTMLRNFKWSAFLIGVLFAWFGMPLFQQLLLKLRPAPAA